MQLPNTSDYLTWARDVSRLLHEKTDYVDLFNSAIHTPTKMLHADIQRANAADLEERFEEPTGWGLPRLRSAISQTYHIDRSRILLTTGCSNALVLICHAFVRPGDHVIIETPHYQPLSKVVEAFDARITWLPREGTNYQFDTDRLEETFTPDTRLIILSNLHNPSGTYLSDEVMQQVATIARRHQVKVVVDEVYGDFVSRNLDEIRQGPAATLDDCFISLNSFSKVYGLGILRCGWLLASAGVIEQLRPVHALFETGISHLTHSVASVIFTELERYRLHWVNTLADNHPLIQEFQQETVEKNLLEGELPTYGGIYFPRVVGVKDTLSLTQWLARQHRVLVVPGEFFGKPGHIRVSYSGDPAQLREGLNRLADGLSTYHPAPTD